MRVTFRIMSLAALGPDPMRIPIKCWRATFIIAPDVNGRNIYDGTSMSGMYTDNANAQTGFVRFVVGGVFGPNGEPVLVDKLLDVRLLDLNSTGIVILEDIVP